MAHGMQDESIQMELKQLIRMPAPRRLSPSLRKHLAKKSGRWPLVIFGFLFGAFGSVFCVFFLPWNFLNELSLDKAPPRFVEGRVTHAERTKMSINDVPVWKYEARFGDAAQERFSIGYTTGRSFAEGDEIFVRVHPQKPDLHCPQGMRMSKASLGSAFVLIFPLLGFTLMLSPFFGRKRRYRLYENGTVAEVRVLAVKDTNILINDQRMYQFTLKFANLQETVEVKKSGYEDVHVLQHAYETKEMLHVFYDPKKPKRFVTLDLG